MKEALQKLNKVICKDSTECIFSQESEPGITALTNQDGGINQSGQQAYLVSPSQQQEKDLAKKTSVTYCPTSSILSESANLQQSLENRLRQLLGMGGSMIYTQKWKLLDMKLRQTLYLRALLVLRISDHVYGGSQLVQAWG